MSAPVITGIDSHDWKNLYEEIGTMLFRNSLEPTSENFDICRRYLTADDGELNSRVDRALEEGGLTAVTVAAIIAERSVQMSAEDLGNMAQTAHEQLAYILSLIEQSGRDTQLYGDTLAQKTRALEENAVIDDTIKDLVLLTHGMIQQTRMVEEKLRHSGSELTDLKGKLAEAQHQADHDPLTRLPNRRAVQRKLKYKFDSAWQDGKSFSLAIVDIDRFKSINTTHGYGVGDEVLRFFGALLAKDFGHIGYVARLTGEEFLLMFEEESVTEAAEILECLRQKFSKLDLKISSTGARLGRMTFSAGIASSKNLNSLSELMHAADKALQDAKAQGRDKVNIYIDARR